MPSDPELVAAVERALARMEMGKEGYKDKLPPKLIRAIQEAPLTDVPESRALNRKALSVREREIILFISHGATLTQTAEHLEISVDTVKTHMKRIRDKLGARNTAHAIRLAFEGGWIE